MIESIILVKFRDVCCGRMCYDIYGFQALFDILANRLRQLRTGSGSGSVDADGSSIPTAPVMKKSFIILLLSVIMLTGCGKETLLLTEADYELNLESNTTSTF